MENTPQKPRGRTRRTDADRAKMEQIGQRLQDVRLALGLSQADIADLLEIHQTSWSLYERGSQLPDFFQIPRILAKLRITYEFLLENDIRGLPVDLAIRIAARRPELVSSIGKVPRKGTDQT